ncbi:glycosyl hydrolase family protein [Candidatus Aerophobetes bacterium]|uniref:Glycosyl hydrolase family protein n=1 Tax=Aerophobetes bacterium TaxID=2030807 RepID=A0A523S243_UNCAE|nr:MAG: glycosyl hydrolase family protein [Candidatus Aerophobetes bacterium]
MEKITMSAVSKGKEDNMRRILNFTLGPTMVLILLIVLGVQFIPGEPLIREQAVASSGTRRSWLLQEGNNLPKTGLQHKQSHELEDNRIGQQASLEADIYTKQDVNYFVNQYINLGLKRARLTMERFEWDKMDWSNLEEYSKFNIGPYHDKAITGLADNGIKITYFLFFWDPESPGKEVTSGYSRFKTEDEIQRYLDYTKFIVNHFKGRIEYYEILNEPITGSGTQQSVEVADYINLVRRVVPVIRKEDLGAKVVVGAIPNLYNPGDYKYLLNILNSEIMPLVDGISFHPMHGVSPDYELKEDYYKYPSVIQEIKDVASAHGFEGEYFADELIWRNSEIPLESEPWVYSEIAVAKYYARGIVMNLGMDLNVGLALESVEEQPLMVRVIQNLCTIMAGAKPVSLPIEIQSKATNIRNYNFSLSNGDKLIALWTDGVAVDDDPGVKATLISPGFSAQKVMGIDVLNGFEQQLVVNIENGNLLIHNLLVKDYPIIIRLIDITSF